MFDSVQSLKAALADVRYLVNDDVATVVYLADRLDKPLLIEGPAGVGKTEMAKALAAALDTELIRLQCYEGLDEAKALYEWQYAKQMLYTQLLRDRTATLLADTASFSDAFERLAAEEDLFFAEQFLLPRPLLRALVADKRPVLLIDEIDKTDPEFEAFLLEVLSDYQVSVPELGTIKAATPPLVLLTSNQQRDLSDALKRRCLHLSINYPSLREELEIVRVRTPEVPEALAREVVTFIHQVRRLALKKVPGISETIEWARALTVLNASTLERSLIEQTLGVFVKYESDSQRVRGDLTSLLRGTERRLEDW
ncbi:MAG: MoxR family ATPase [Ardenticatenales bacterium]|nr:MoxR family ATPase [Ardenticatenales bacterium]